MYQSVSRLVTFTLIFCFYVTAGHAQLGEYEFDGGGDGISWDDAANWNVTLNPDGTPAGGGNPPTPPDALTDASIPLGGVVINSTMPGQTARNVNIGTANGAGSLSLSTGGGLTASTDFNVGNGGAGAFDMSGGSLVALDDITVGAGTPGQITISDGIADVDDDFTINADSTLHMTGGAIHVGDRLVLQENASVTVGGGEIVADDDFFFFGSSRVTVDGGFMEVADKLRFDDVVTTGKLTINSGLVRTQEFGFVDDFDNYIMNGVAEINGDGVLQVELGGPDAPFSQLTVSSAKALIAEGIHLTTSEASPLKLGARLVVVPDFFGNADVNFVQISVVPEPTTCLLLGLGSLGCLLRRRRPC